MNSSAWSPGFRLQYWKEGKENQTPGSFNFRVHVFSYFQATMPTVFKEE